jgi:hypothetical protein
MLRFEFTLEFTLFFLELRSSVHQKKAKKGTPESVYDVYMQCWAPVSFDS